MLYVGKARNLKARVSNYARPAGHPPRIARMIRETASMMFLTTRTETEALLLEQNLIKQLKPRYNVLLRDDKSFPNILVTRDHAFPQIKKHRGAKKEKGNYYGPFASAGAVNRTLNQLQKVFLLRNCSDSMFESRTRPCLLYQIKRCSAPCVGYIGEAAYADAGRRRRAFPAGQDAPSVQAHLAREMDEAAEAMEFERAAALRDRIRALTQVQSAQGINPQRRGRGGRHRAPHGGRAGLRAGVLHPRQPELGQPRLLSAHRLRRGGAAEVMQAFIGQFYADTRAAAPDPAVPRHRGPRADGRGAEREGRAARCRSPCRSGARRPSWSRAPRRNARESLARRMAETATQGKLLDGLAEAFDLDGAADADRGLRQLATSWAPTPSAR